MFFAMYTFFTANACSQILSNNYITEYLITPFAFFAFLSFMQNSASAKRGKLRCICVCDSLSLTNLFNSTLYLDN